MNDLTVDSLVECKAKSCDATVLMATGYCMYHQAMRQIKGDDWEDFDKEMEIYRSLKN